MMHLAKEYGLSDVGMAKLCKRLDIPRPPRGYWAKLEFGHRVRKTPLPDPDDDCELVMNGPNEYQVGNRMLSDEVQKVVAEERQEDLRIVVAETLRGSHELTSQANQELQVAEKDDRGLIVKPEVLSLDVQVSKPQLRRALLIMDALLKALEQRGYTVARGPCVTILGEEISFGIRELVDAVREQPDEHDLEGSYSFGHSRYFTKYVPSGRILLHIHDAGMHWANGCRKSWRDAKKQKVEDCLNKFVAGLVEVAARKKEHRIEEKRREAEAAEAERRRQEEARIREEKRKLQKQEQASVDELFQQAECWNRSQDLRRFIEAVKQQHLDNGESLEPGSEVSQWTAWAMRQADRVDPLCESPPSILDEKIPEEPKRWSW